MNRRQILIASAAPLMIAASVKAPSAAAATQASKISKPYGIPRLICGEI